VLQQTVAGFEVRCCASQRLHQARRGVHSCVQAAAAARVGRGRDIFESAKNGDGASVLCHLIADADAVNKRDGWLLPAAPLCPSFIFIIFMRQVKFILLLSFRQRTPLHYSASKGHLEVTRLLLQCNSDIEAKDWR
jgi:hypothetical protein